jgi:intracellular sulfur oxidation DsrE/DsrF family protein
MTALEGEMKILTIAAFCTCLFLIDTHELHARDDSLALSGLTSVRAVFDVRTSDEKALQFMFTVIRDTFDETVHQGVKPHYVVSMRGPTVKFLVRSRQGDQELQQKTLELIGDLNKRGLRMDACGYALNLFGLEAEDLVSGIEVVGNSLNSLIGYQIKGYALVPMN